MMINEPVQVKNEVLQEQLFYKRKMILRYKIEYPQFSSMRFQRTLNRINQFYRTKALDYQKYLKTSFYDDAVAQYEDSIKNHYPVRAFEAVLAYKMTYNKNCTISLYFDKYEFTGGAHGNTIRNSDSWYLPTGRRISLNELFSRSINPRTYIINVINTQIAEQIKNGNNIYFENYQENVAKYFNPSSFYLTDQGIVIYFQQYEIAPYSSGIPEFLIPYDNRTVREPRCR